MITIFVGTETGTAEFVADDIKDLLNKNNIEANIVDDEAGYSTIINGISAGDDEKDPQTWIVCTSTHGAGEVPDNLKPLITMLGQLSSLKQIKHLVIGLGDSSYDTYCKAANDISDALTSLHSAPIHPPILVDAMSEELPEDLIIPQLQTILSDL